jgi:hypothetical protein
MVYIRKRVIVQNPQQPQNQRIRLSAIRKGKGRNLSAHKKADMISLELAILYIMISKPDEVE